MILSLLWKVCSGIREDKKINNYRPGWETPKSICILICFGIDDLFVSNSMPSLIKYINLIKRMLDEGEEWALEHAKADLK